jgi:hypothetical protein
MNKQERPRLLTLICILGFAASVLSFPSIFSPFIKKKGAWFPALSGAMVALEFISVVGVWYMKRWGISLYLGSAMGHQIIWLWMDTWSPAKIFLPLSFLICSLPLYKKMDDNL